MKNNLHHPTKHIRCAIVAILVLFCSGIRLQASSTLYPVNASIMLMPPYSVYLMDYSAPASEKLSVVLTLNDLNEAYRDVYLRLTIESAGAKLQTRVDFFPTPTRLMPGEPLILKGNDLDEYFNYQHLDIMGISRQQLMKNGRLPEGFYTFSIEVLDYASRQIISRKASFNANIALNDPPIVVLPQNGSVIKVSDIQQIMFQWQLTNADPTNTEYKLSLYEITDPVEKPENAIANQKALQIFESDNSSYNTLMYDMSMPLLQKGKRYVYTVQAFSKDDRDIYKNSGKSQVYWFSYGYPEGGTIELKNPSDKGGFSIRSRKYFNWGAPDNLTPNQPLVYNVRIVKQNNLPENTAIEQAAFYEYNSDKVFTPTGGNVMLEDGLESMNDYVWQVKALSDEQTVAKSKVWSFKGPPVIEEFYAGTHLVTVTRTDNADLNDLSGNGTIKLSNNGAPYAVRFEHLGLRYNAGLYVLSSGQIINKLVGIADIVLKPTTADNNEAVFHPDTLRLNSDGLYYKGTVEWELPFATNSADKAKVRCTKGWISYDSFTLLGMATLNGQNDFQLLEPSNFRLKLNETSAFIINNNNYTQRFDGFVELPIVVKGNVQERVQIPFSNFSQLYYNTLAGVALSNNIQLVKNTGMVLQPRTITIDLSGQQSPPKFSSNANWKGLYFDKFDIAYAAALDNSNQIALTTSINYNFDLQTDINSKAWIEGMGLTLVVEKDFKTDDKCRFNNFPSLLKKIQLNIENNSISKSFLYGNIKIPIIDKKDYDYTVPISEDGFQTGYLNSSLDGIKFVYNAAGGSQKLNIGIKRAVFANKDRIEMVIDIEWPSLNISMNSLSGFTIWGNYDIGFINANGMASLTQQVAGKLDDYVITMNTIGAGRQGNVYAIGTSATIVVSEDVSGANGPPVVNIYSIEKNDLLGEYQAAFNTSSAQAENTANNTASTKKGMMDNIGSMSPDSTMAQVTRQIRSQISFSPIEIIENANALINKTIPNEVVTPIDKNAIIANSNDDSNSGSKPLTAAQKAAMLQHIQRFVSKNSSEYTKGLDIITTKMALQIDTVMLEMNTYVKKNVELLVKSISDETSKQIKDAEMLSIVNNISDRVIKEVTNSVMARVKNYVDTAVTNPLKTLGSTLLVNTVSRAFSSFAETIIESGFTSIDYKTMFANAATEVSNNKSFGNIRKNITGKANGLITEAINPEAIVNSIKDGLLAAVKDIAKKKIEKAATEYVSSKVGEYGGQLFSNVAANIPMDMGNVAEKLAKGDLKGALSLDKVKISVNSRIVNFAGEIQYTKADPTFGDVWQGDITGTIKTPKAFDFTVKYITGKKDDYNYWFCQAVGASGKFDMRDTIPREMSTPVDMGPISMVAVAGRLYHNMYDDGKTITPNKSIDYGAYLHLVFFDAANDGATVRFEVAAAISTQTNGDYTINFNGNLQVKNDKVSIATIDKSAMGQGLVRFSYNSAKKHFIGYGKLIVNKPGVLCAEGSLLVDVEPGKWRIALGSREERLVFVPTCSGWSPTGWLDVNQNTAELGLGLMYSIHAGISFDVGIVGLGINVDGGVAAGIQAKCQYNPSFALMEAGIWVDIWAKVMVDYSINLLVQKKGSFTLLDIYASADLLMIFSPPPTTLKGSVSGYIEFCGIVSTDFSASTSMSL